jgi:hypothetical protein
MAPLGLGAGRAGFGRPESGTACRAGPYRGGPQKSACVETASELARCLIPGSDHGIALLHGFRGAAEVGRAYRHPAALSRLVTTHEVDMNASVHPSGRKGLVIQDVKLPATLRLFRDWVASPFPCLCRHLHRMLLDR